MKKRDDQLVLKLLREINAARNYGLLNKIDVKIWSDFVVVNYID